MKNVHCITFNWFVGDQGEEFAQHQVGYNGVTRIEPSTHLQGPKRFWIVTFECGRQELIYNPNRIFVAAPTEPGSNANATPLSPAHPPEGLPW